MTMPGRVIALDDTGVMIRCGDEEYRATTLLVPDVAVGDYVLVQAGLVIERLTREEAAEIAAALDALLAPPPDLADPAPRPGAG